MNDRALVQLDSAMIALAECKTVMEAKQIGDVAEAARVYLQRTNASAETVNRATEIRLLAERQMGAFLKAMPKATGGERGGRAPIDGPRAEPSNTPATLAEIGITKKQSASAQKLADIPAEEFHERIAVAKASGGKLSAAAVIDQKPISTRAMTEAWGLWSYAKGRLDNIRENDPERERVFFEVISYATKRMK